ncbi:MAG: metallophosphoesterase, partial [Pseudomonadota bacterium]
LEGFTLLHLSDLHLRDTDVRDGGPLVEAVQAQHTDALVITGDLLLGSPTHRSREARTLAPIERLLKAVDAPAFAVLGDEDHLWMVPHLEAMGVRLLVNESALLTHRGARLYLAGVDDSAYYKADDVDAALQSIPTGSLSVLLSHSPEIYQRAAAAGFDVMLSGHTHGGQLCLPNGQPLFRAGNAPRAFARGRWSFEGLLGYTSSGCGATPLGMRWNCPAEVAFHRLTGGA